MRDVEEEAGQDRRQARIGEFVEAIERGRGLKGLPGGVVNEVRMLTNKREAGDALLVVKASAGGERWVAFVGARNVGEAMLTWRQKDRGKGLRWRKDKPWGT